MSEKKKIRQKATSRRDSTQVGRDYNRLTKISIFSENNLFYFFSKPFEVLRNFIEKGKQIERLKEQLNEKDRNIEILKRDYRREVDNLRVQYQKTIEEQKRKIEYLREDLKRKIDDYYKAQEFIQSSKKIISDLIDRRKTENLNDEFLSNLNNIIVLFDESEEDKEIKACMNASAWIAYRKNDWAKEALTHTLESYPEISERAETFFKDICDYLNWLQDSLFYALPLPFDEFVSNRTYSHNTFYRSAFSYIKNQRDFGELFPKEIKYLQDSIEYLINHL